MNEPSEVISSLISAHLNKDDSIIRLHEGLHIEPQINHTGKMSVNAYMKSRWPNAWKKSRRFTNASRKFVGVLDFKIIDPNGKMEHDTLLREVMDLLSSDHVIGLYHGIAPNELGLNEGQMVVATNLMCAFIEQEVNWGVNNFQLHTNFGSTEFNKFKCEYLERAVPRDYFCSHILYLFEQMERNSNRDIDSIVDEFLEEWLTGSTNARKRIIGYPVKAERIVKSHRKHMLSFADRSVRPWIEPHLDEISRVCVEIGDNPRWQSFYENDEDDCVLFMEKHPLKDKGVDWPIVRLLN